MTHALPTTETLHPAWCTPQRCKVGQAGEGDGHVAYRHMVSTVFGSALWVGITREELGNEARVLLVSKLVDDELNSLSPSEWLEPEESRHLARRLVQVADEVERLNR